MSWINSNEIEDEVLEADLEELEEEPGIADGDSDYVAVRRIFYEVVEPHIKVTIGDPVPQMIIDDLAVFENLLSKKAIKKGGK